MTNESQDPYQPPGSRVAGRLLGGGNVHQWSGHSIRVTSHAIPRACWLVNEVVVSVDGGPPTTGVFPVGQLIPFTVRHEGQDLTGAVRRDDGLYTSRVEYSLLIDGVPAEQGRLQTGNWRLAVVTFLAAVYFAAVPWLFNTTEPPWQFTLSCVVGSLISSIATMRLIVGDFSVMLRARSGKQT